VHEPPDPPIFCCFPGFGSLIPRLRYGRHPSPPSSGVASRAPSRQSSTPDLSESHLYIRDFVRETCQCRNFTSVQLPILDNNQLSELSDGETILVPLSCSALNALVSLTRQLDTITTQLGNIQAMVATLPTYPAVEKVFETTLAPINASLRDLSQRVSAATHPQAQAPARAPIPPTSVTTQPTPLPAQPRAKDRPPPRRRLPRPLSIRTFPDTTWTPAPSTVSLAPMRTSTRIPGRQTRSLKRLPPTPPLSSRATSPLIAPDPNPRTPRPPPRVPRRARRIRAPSRPPKSHQPVTSHVEPRDPGCSIWPKGDSTLLVLPPLITRTRP